MTVTLALDLGTNMGFALLRADGRIESGAKSFPPPRPPLGPGARFIEFRNWLGQLNSERGPISRIVYERVVHVGDSQAYASQLYGGFLAVLLMFTEVNRVPCEGFNLATVKKAWTGRGNADKASMIIRCEKLGFRPTSSDEADAIAILHVGLGRAPAIPIEDQAKRLKRKPKPNQDRATASIPFDPF